MVLIRKRSKQKRVRKLRKRYEMAFSNDDILTLAKVGFTAQQIAALSMVGSAAPTVNTTAPAPAPTAPAPAPTAPAPTAPAPAPTAPAPTAPATTAPATTDDILKAINGLGANIQSGLLQTAQQPTPVTAESILAEIINPPQKPTNK